MLLNFKVYFFSILILKKSWMTNNPLYGIENNLIFFLKENPRLLVISNIYQKDADDVFTSLIASSQLGANEVVVQNVPCKHSRQQQS